MLKRTSTLERDARTGTLAIRATTGTGWRGTWADRRRWLTDTGVQQADAALMWAVLALLLLGLVMVYSASIAVAERKGFANASSTWFLTRHAISIGVGVVAGTVLFAVPPRGLQRIALPAFIVTLILLALVFVPGLGRTVNGATRWLNLGVATVQPSEFMKLAMVLYAADYATRRRDRMQVGWRGLLPMVGALTLVSLLILMETDLGALMVIVIIAVGVLFLGGLKRSLFITVGSVIACMGLLAVVAAPFRLKRFIAYLEPFDQENRLKAAYQLTHSLMAIGKGEFLGTGLGAGVVKLNHLPEPHTDFLFAIIGEELGLAGMLLVVGLLFFVVRRCLEVGSAAAARDDLFCGLVAQGIGLWIGAQAFINLGVNLGLLPTKGLTLPLMSYGGNGLVMNCIALGIVLRIDFENRRAMRGRVL